MRTLMWFSIGFASACAEAAYLLTPAWLLPCGIGCLLCAVALFFVRPQICKICAVIFLGCSIGFSGFWCYYRTVLLDAVRLDGLELQTAITVTQYSEENDYGVLVEGTISYEGKTYRVYTYLNEEEQLVPGDQIKGTFVIRYNAYGGEMEGYSRQTEKIFLRAEIEESDVIRTDTPKETMPQYLRTQILQLLDKIFPQDTVSFAKALLLGQTDDLPYDLRSAFATTGISHVVAVSGLHIGVLFSFINVLLARRRWLVAFVGIPVLILFSAIAGFTPSVVRACIMQILLVVASLLYRSYDGPTALATAVLVLLGVNPLVVTSVSFQLSVGCMVGIIAFGEKIYGYLSSRKWIANATAAGFRAGFIRGVLASIAISVSVWIVTAPLCAVYFGSISVVSIIANLLLVWMMMYIFCAVAAACVAGALWLPLGIGLGWLTAWPVRLVRLAAIAISQIPFAAVYTASAYVVIWLLSCYALFALFKLLKYRAPWLFISCVSLLLACAVLAGCIEERSTKVSVTVLDMGQGQCVILKQDDQYYMVDCGGTTGTAAADKAVAYLRSNGIFTLEGLILTQLDHGSASGAADLLATVPVGQLYLPDIEDGSEIYRELAYKYEDKICYIDETCRINGSSITMIHINGEDEDEQESICVLFQPENYDILINSGTAMSGDLTLLDEYEIPPLDIMVDGHGGSGSSGWMQLLKTTMPDTVVISAGNAYESTRSINKTMGRLELFGCSVLRVDVEGTIKIKG